MLTSAINPYPAAQGATSNGPSSAERGSTLKTPLEKEETELDSSTAGLLLLRRRSTRSEDLRILSHAQGQLRSHLAPRGSRASASAVRNAHSPQAQPQPQFQPQTQSPVFPSAQWSQNPGSAAATAPSAPRPRPRSAHETKRDLRTPVTNLPFRWWEHGLLSPSDAPDHRPSTAMLSNPYAHSPSNPDSSDEEEIRESIEPADHLGESVVQSVETHNTPSPMTGVQVKSEDAGREDSEEEARIWDEAQRGGAWRGYVQHKQSWVRRAGLKRERDDGGGGGGGGGGAKRGRSGV